MWELLVKGGWLMWPILGCGLIGTILFLERVFHLHRAQIKREDFMNGIYTVVNRGNTTEAVSICDQTPGPVAQMVRVGLLHADEEPAKLKKTITQVGLSEVPRLERNLGGLLSIAQIAPLLGLMGTIVGLIRIFMLMEQQAPLIEIGELSSGIWQALITSAVGIAIAIPSLVGYNFLLSRVDNITLDMEFAAEELYRFLAYERTNTGEGHEA